MVNTPAPCIPLTKSLQTNAQVSRPRGIYRVKAHEMPKTLPLIAVLSLAVVLPAHAAEPAAATPRNAAQWCKAWRAETQTEKLNALFPSGGGYVLTFSTRNGNGTTKKSLFGRCVSLTTKKLAAERRAAREGAGGASLQTRCRSDLASGAPHYASLGRCITDEGRQIST